MTRHVSAVFDNHEQAARAIRTLQEHDFSDREFSVIAKPDDQDGQSEALHQRSLEQENARGGAWTGSVLGAAVAGSVGLVSMALIPAIPLLVVGGAAAGGVAGKLFGGLGLGQHQSKETEAALQAGGVLVVVHQETEERARKAQELLESLPSKGVSVSN